MLQTFLNNKPLFYDEIDYSRMPRVFERVKKNIKIPKTIHIIGTNGKGTTGRFLASALYAKGFNVGHYSSPHIIDFNERVWLNGKNVSNRDLDKAHQKLLNILTPQESNSLSYFEYTTLISMVIFENLEYVILEAGLGGEYDATAVFPKLLTVVTPIGIDHEAFLGDNIEDIVTTKLNAIENIAILGKQKNVEVYQIADNIAKKNRIKIILFDSLLEEEDFSKIDNISDYLSLAPYLSQNLQLAIAVLKYLKIEYDAKDFYNAKLFGRLSSLNSNILLDVGHNILASESIANSLKDQKYILIYNSYKDKNYKKILSILKPIIEHIELIDIVDERIEDKNILRKTIATLEILCKDFIKIDNDKKYLVFGSFKVVEEFLKKYNA